MDNDKPIGTYECVRCNCLWDGSEVYSQSIGAQGITCGDIFCGANVRKISDDSKVEYKKKLESLSSLLGAL